MKLRFENGPLRIVVVAFAMASWLLAFNHCAVAAFSMKPTQAEEHSHCGGHQKPSKKSENEALPCCKTLSATAATVAKNVVQYDSLSFVTKDYFAGVLCLPQAEPLLSLSVFDDTGPPGSFSFAESVLQRSILAHAPPFVA